MTSSPLAHNLSTSSSSSSDLSFFNEIFEKGLQQLPRSLYGRVRNADTKIAQVDGQTITFTAKSMLQAKVDDFTRAMQQIFGTNWQIQLVDVNQWRPQPATKTYERAERIGGNQNAIEVASSADSAMLGSASALEPGSNNADNAAAQTPVPSGDVNTPAPAPATLSTTTPATSSSINTPAPANLSTPATTSSNTNAAAPVAANSANTANQITSDGNSTKTENESQFLQDNSPSDTTMASTTPTNPVDAVLQAFQGKIIQED